jgi:uncharacterized OsmC-like protein
MVQVKHKLAVIEVSASCPTHSRTEVKVRDTQSVIDEPLERGGTNQGPSPTEALIAAITGCSNVVINKLAKANNVEVHSLAIQARAEFDRRGPQLIAEVETPFPSLHLTIDISTNAEDGAMAKIKDGLHRYCPLHKVIEASGTKVTETWHVSPT